MRFGFPSHSLRARVTLSLIVPLVVILGFFTTIEYLRHRKFVLDSLSVMASYTGRVVEDNLHHAMLQSDFGEVQATLDSIASNEEIEVLYLLDTSGEVIFAPNGENIGIQLDNRQSACQPCHALPAAERPTSIVVTDENGQRVFRSMQPIENEPACAECHGADERLRGVLLVDISVGPMQADLNANLRENLLWLGITLLVTVLVVNLVMNRFVLQRLESFAANIAGFGDGRKPHFIPQESQDEIGQLAQAFKVMATQIETRRAEKAELLKRLMTAQEEERKRVARELHDGTSQSLTSLLVQLEMIESTYTQVDTLPALAGHMDDLRGIITQTLEEVHDMALQLRPSVLDDMGLPTALERLVSDWRQRHTLHIDLTIHGLDGRRLQPAIETALYRIIQEALTNVVRHARAKNAGVIVNQRKDIIQIIVEDDGDGFEPDATGHAHQQLGLIGIRERAEILSGKVTLESAPGKGTTVYVELPVAFEEVTNGATSVLRAASPDGHSEQE